MNLFSINFFFQEEREHNPWQKKKKNMESPLLEGVQLFYFVRKKENEKKRTDNI